MMLGALVVALAGASLGGGGESEYGSHEAAATAAAAAAAEDGLSALLLAAESSGEELVMGSGLEALVAEAGLAGGGNAALSERRRAQLGLGGLGGVDLGNVGAAVDQFDPPVISFSGSFVDNPDGQTSEGTQTRMTTDPGAGVFVDVALLSFNETETAKALDKYMQGASYPNTTVAEIYYKLSPCSEPLCEDERLPNGFNGRMLDQGTVVDRGKADGFVSGGGGVVINGSGPMIFEAFTVLSDLTARSETWTNTRGNDVLAISKVLWLNITVMPGVSPPIFDPPQDFYSATINVTFDTVSDEAHVFYTLQPPFISDKNGTWCPKMGSWCTHFGSGGTFHAVPDQRPNFLYSQRGLFTRLFDVRANETWSAPIPGAFPFGSNLTLHAEEHDSAEFMERFAADRPLLDPATGEPLYKAENISLYPMYTAQMYPGGWLLFEPRISGAVEDFAVDVSTCYNHSYVKTVTVQGQNHSSNVTELECEHAMHVPAANPCPWSRDCKLLGEVSFKLRAYALRTGYVASQATSGLYTFIQAGFPRWMNRRDDCGGWRQSTANPHLRYAVSEETIWDVLAPYDCPPGWHWASSAEGVQMLGYEGDQAVPWAPNVSTIWDTGNSDRHRQRFERHFTENEDLTMTYSDMCGWAELEWEGKFRQFFRFSDSGPRYQNYVRPRSPLWPDEAHFFAGERPESRVPRGQNVDAWRDHVTAWRWYEGHENFAHSVPYELPALYDPPTGGTWAMKAADSLDYLGLETWSGDQLGNQPDFAGAVCRTNGDWTPPRVVILGPLIVTLEVHTPYVEYGAQAWDPVDDVWYPEWKTYDGVEDDLDDGIVRITGHVDYHKVGVYYMYYDATDFHGNDAVQQVRTIIILDRTIPELTVTAGMHQRVCEPLTDAACTEPFKNISYDGLTSQPCPAQHTCSTILGSWDPPRQFGYINPTGERTSGTQITIEVGTEYVELGATATDNLKGPKKLTASIQRHEVGPLKHRTSVQRVYPLYPEYWRINKALKKYRSEVYYSIGGAAGVAAADAVTAQDVIDLGLVEDPNEFGLRILENCRAGDGEAPGQPKPLRAAQTCPTGSCNLGRYTRPTEIWADQYEVTTSKVWDEDAEEFVYTANMPDYCGFDWGSETVGVEPNVDQPAEEGWLTFETNETTVWFDHGYELPCTLSKEQPHIEFDFVNYQLPGVYNVTYDVSDDFNNTADTVWRTVTVKDTTPPVLHLEGDPIMFVRYNTSFEDPGATATDTGDDYYYELNRMNISACTSGRCTTEHVNKSINDKIVTRVHHERLECEHIPIFPQRNETPPICLMARMSMNTADKDHEEAYIQCPQGQIISGYNFISYGRPEGSCEEQQYEPLMPSEDCFLSIDTEIGEKVPADIAMFEHECVGRVNCTLSSDWEYYNPSQFGGFLDGEDFGAVDPCPGQLKWLLVEATCAYNDTQEAIGSYVECRDEHIQLPRLGVSTQPPLLGELDRSLPGTKPGQYPLGRFDGTWKNMDDFLSRLDPDLAAANEKYVHQDIWGENEFLRTRIEDELFVDTNINLLTLGLYVITYDVTDMAGNEATQISRFVIVQDDSELYQNSIQQVYDGTDGTFTGGVLPHEVGGTVRVAGEVMELSRNRPTAASSLWGVHTPSSSAVDGLYENAYVMPFSPMDEYGRMLAQDHIPNIFMSGPADWRGDDPPTDPQWWMVHLSSYTNNPTVVVYTRDCCTDQFSGRLDVYLTDTDTPPTAGGGNGTTSTLLPCSTMGTEEGEELSPNGVFETVCDASGEYLFIVGGPWIHFAEVEVFGMGGGNGLGRFSAEEMNIGYREDVGLHFEGAQYAITVPVANVTSDWWVGVPFVTGRQLVLELNTTWPGETRSVRADIHHAREGGVRDGHRVWRMTATGELRRVSDGYVYDGLLATLIEFSVREESATFVNGRVEYVLTYASLQDTTDRCTCDHELERQEGVACEVQCPPDMSKPRLANLRTAANGHVTSVSAEIPAAYRGAFAAAWGQEWLADTLGVAVEDITGLRIIDKDGWRNTHVEAAPESSLVLDTYPTGQSRVVLGCGPRDDDLHDGRYFLTVHSTPLYKVDSTLRSSSSLTGPDTVHTSKIAEAEYQAVPYSIRATYVEPILLPSAVDVYGTISEDITTIYYFETYLNQKIALELAGPEGAEDGVSAVLSYEECTDRDDDFGYLGKGRLQTYKSQSNRPPGYDFISYCPNELRPGRYYVEMRASKAVDYTLRLSEYTPYCPNNCTGGLGYGDCDCTILRCICKPGYYGDDCSDHPAVAVVDSYPFMKKSTTLAHQGGGEPGRGTVFNLTCPEGYVVVGLTGSYYDHYNPKSYMGKLVRRVNLICQPLLGYGILGTRSNETEIVTNNHSLSIYSRTLSRYSERQEYLSPEQLDLDCTTPGGKGHLDECRLLHGIWSAQQTIYTEDEKQYAWTCGPNEVFVGQTVDVLSINQTCEEDGFGCSPKVRMCQYTVNEESFYRGGGRPVVEQHNITIPCYELCEYTEVLDDPVCQDLAYCIEHNRTTTSSFTFHILCNDTRVQGATSVWAKEESDAYWPGNAWDWRSQKSFGEYPNDYYDTFHSDLVHGGEDLLSLARDLMLIGSDFNAPFVYSQQPEGDTVRSEDAASGRRRLEAWGAIERLHRGVASQQQAGHERRLQGLGGLEALNDHIENVTTNITEIGWAYVPGPHHYDYITEVGGICEKLSFAHNTSSPGAAVHVRYEDDRHYPVDKVVGAGARDTALNMQGCSGESCPSGDQTDPKHNKHRCPAGSVVTGIVTHSGDWLDSVEYVCSQMHVFNSEEWKLYQLNIDAEEQERLQETLDKLEQLASLAQLAQLSQLSGLGDLGR